MKELPGPHQFVGREGKYNFYCELCGGPEKHALHGTAPERSETATIPYGNILTSLEGLTLTLSEPDAGEPRFAFVTNKLGEKVYIFASDNLYLTHAEPAAASRSAGEEQR
jgi:hypothetical protein